MGTCVSFAKESNCLELDSSLDSSLDSTYHPIRGRGSSFLSQSEVRNLRLVRTEQGRSYNLTFFAHI